jgi:imidazolonepropionase-like amidohydrolase
MKLLPQEAVNAATINGAYAMGLEIYSAPLPRETG